MIDAINYKEKLLEMTTDELFDFLANAQEIHDVSSYLPSGMKIISEKPIAINCFEYAFGIGGGYFPDGLVKMESGEVGSVVVYHKINWNAFLESVKSGQTFLVDSLNAPQKIELLESVLNYPEFQKELWRKFRNKLIYFATSPVHAGIVLENGNIESQWGNHNSAPIIRHNLEQVPGSYKIFGPAVVSYFAKPMYKGRF
jgi:hypothetical protein